MTTTKAYVCSDRSKFINWGPNEPPTFKNKDTGNIMAAVIFELQTTEMLYLEFQRGKVHHNFHVCALFHLLLYV